MGYDDGAPWPERIGQERKGNFYGLGAYKSSAFPMVADGNVYLDQAKAFETETKPVENPNFKTHTRLIEKKDGIYLEISMDSEWMQRQRKLVTSGLLGKAATPDMPFVQPDGTLYCLDTDYSGKKRNLKNPAPGPFGKIKDGMITIMVWQK
jgi:alpha-N-arabinofuranosidase